MYGGEYFEFMFVCKGLVVYVCYLLLCMVSIDCGFYLLILFVDYVVYVVSVLEDFCFVVKVIFVVCDVWIWELDGCGCIVNFVFLNVEFVICDFVGFVICGFGMWCGLLVF